MPAFKRCSGSGLEFLPAGPRQGFEQPADLGVDLPLVSGAQGYVGDEVITLGVKEDLLYPRLGVEAQALAGEVIPDQQAADKIVAGGSEPQPEAAHGLDAPGVIPGEEISDRLFKPGQQVALENTGEVFSKLRVEN